MILYSFIFFMLIFVGVGFLASRKSQKSSKDYLLSSGDVSPALSALSMMASKLSGYMFIGFIGVVYLNGVAAAWLMFGLLTGDIIVFYTLSSKLKKLHNQYNSLSYEDLVSQRFSGVYKKLRFFLAVMILIFLSIYASAQLKASSKALQAVLGWSEISGTILCAFFVLFYSWSGGIRASIWTDAVQAIVMLASSVGLTIYSLIYLGGWKEFMGGLQGVSSNYFTLFPENSGGGGVGGFLLFLIGWVFSGLCILGQPHVMVRIMVLDKIENLRKMRIYYYLANNLLFVFLFFVGLACRLILKDVGVGEFDPEMALPLLSLKLMPAILVGIVLAGIFSSVMSTVDSQIISCSAAISQSIMPKVSLLKNRSRYHFTKLLTVILVIVTTLTAIFSSGSIFDMVVFSWSTLGVTLGTAACLQILFPSIKETMCLFIVFVGGLVTVLWRMFGLSPVVTEAFPGIISVITIVCLYKIYKAMHLRSYK